MFQTGKRRRGHAEPAGSVRWTQKLTAGSAAAATHSLGCNTDTPLEEHFTMYREMAAASHHCHHNFILHLQSLIELTSVMCLEQNSSSFNVVLWLQVAFILGWWQVFVETWTTGSKLWMVSQQHIMSKCINLFLDAGMHSHGSSNSSDDDNEPHY